MNRRVTVVEYGLGNLHSVIKALRYHGAEVDVTDDPAKVCTADRIVLPGVGAFADGIHNLQTRGLIPALDAYFCRQRPFLGICLGMQLLFTESAEFGQHRGLDAICGRVIEIPRAPGRKVPHIGWSRLVPRPGGDWNATLLEGAPCDAMVYFVHSFMAVPACESDRLADTDYGGCRIAAIVHNDNILGCQFHPEKSGPTGLALLARFLTL